MLTVVMPTRNGAEWIGQCLEAFSRLQSPNGNYKLIVVDNGSEDSTGAILQNFSDRLPLQLLSQPDPGKNKALNAAIPHLQGDLIVFADDDIVPAPDWLVNMRALAARHPDCAMFGGRVTPLWPSPPAEAILKGIPLTAAFALHPQSLQDGLIGAQFIWGLNMAIRREIFDKGYRFNETVGPKPGNYIMGGEFEFTRRLADDGYQAAFANNVLVQHIIRPRQLTFQWLMLRAFRHGRQEYRRLRPAEKQDWGVIMGYPRWQLRKLLQAYLSNMKAQLMGDDVQKYRCGWKLATLRGWLFQARHGDAA
ncbi:MAG: hypothetical protein Tsb0016_12620 [Sphingomonadales bacterium]